MTSIVETEIIGLCLLFCRIGGCLLLSPGLSSPRVPVHVRLFLCLAATAAVSPLLIDDFRQQLASVPEPMRINLILRETAVGVLLGLMSRCFFLALQFAATATSNFIGLSGIPGIPLEDSDTGSPLATLASTAAVAIIFTLGLHVELLRAVVESYSVLPLDGSFRAELFLTSLLGTLGETWRLALRLSAPFLLYGVIVNFALGLGNRFAQQISLYHATTGAVMLGGFLLLYLVWNDWMILFADSYGSWLVEGGF